MDTIKLLHHIPIFARLSDAQLTLLAERLATQHFARGETIVRQDDPGSVLFIIVRGQVRVYRSGDAGQELSVALLRAGDFFGELALLDGDTRSASVEAMLPTTTLVLNRESFQQSVHRHPEIAIAVLETLASRFRGITRYAEHLASTAAPRRVLLRLIDLAASCGEPDDGTHGVSLHLTQDDLASLCGTTRETVNRVLASLREQGLIRVERARVAIADPDGLQQALSQW
jgi:CRP-like cAMP-binding protein